jgi:hypothetical protein
MIAREWLERGRKAKSPIDAVTDYWRGFNNLYAAARSIGDERTKIRAYLTHTVSDQDAQEILAVDEQALAYLLSKPVMDMRGTGRDTHREMESFTASREPNVKLAELFMIIYQVRCNLEHGNKSPTAERDKDLCRASAPFVAAVVERYA